MHRDVTVGHKVRGGTYAYHDHVCFHQVSFFFLLERMTSQLSCIFRECLIIHTVFIHFVFFRLSE